MFENTIMDKEFVHNAKRIANALELANKLKVIELQLMADEEQKQSLMEILRSLKKEYGELPVE